MQHGISRHRVESIGSGVASIYMRGRNLSRARIEWRTVLRLAFLDRQDLVALSPDLVVRCSYRLGCSNHGPRTGQRDDSTRHLPRGTRVSIEGPYGVFTDAGRTSPKLAIIAAGIGVTPFVR